jgi:SAM-dependent methyltransferase
MTEPAPISHHQDRPSPWVARFAPLIPSGEVLDLACGGGRHARLLAALGHDVIAVDRDPAALALAQGTDILTLLIDLETGALAPGDAPFDIGRYAGIVVANYLHRPLFPLILDSLAPGGVLIYETFARSNERFGKPSNPDFLLAPGELLGLARGRLRVLAYEDGYVESPKPAMVQRLCAIVDGEGAGLDPARLRL